MGTKRVVFELDGEVHQELQKRREDDKLTWADWGEMVSGYYLAGDIEQRPAPEKGFDKIEPAGGIDALALYDLVLGFLKRDIDVARQGPIHLDQRARELLASAGVEVPPPPPAPEPTEVVEPRFELRGRNELDEWVGAYGEQIFIQGPGERPCRHQDGSGIAPPQVAEKMHAAIAAVV